MTSLIHSKVACIDSPVVREHRNFFLRTHGTAKCQIAHVRCADPHLDEDPYIVFLSMLAKMICWEDCSLSIFCVKGLNEWFIVMVSFRIRRTSDIYNFLVDVNFCKFQHTSLKAPYSLFLLRVPLNPNESVFLFIRLLNSLLTYVCLMNIEEIVCMLWNS